MSHVEQITVRLRELSEELRDPAIDDERAGQLAREASDLIAEAETEIDLRLAQASETGTSGAQGEDSPSDG